MSLVNFMYAQDAEQRANLVQTRSKMANQKNIENRDVGRSKSIILCSTVGVVFVPHLYGTYSHDLSTEVMNY